MFSCKPPVGAGVRALARQMAWQRTMRFGGPIGSSRAGGFGVQPCPVQPGDLVVSGGCGSIDGRGARTGMLATACAEMRSEMRESPQAVPLHT